MRLPDRRREASAVSRYVDEARRRLPTAGEADAEHGGGRGDADVTVQPEAAPRGEEPEAMAGFYDKRATPNARDLPPVPARRVLFND